jgi:predicted RNase H-like nuclease (RuvC/YqgF family)
MTKRRGRYRDETPAQKGDKPPISRSSGPFPHLSQFVEEILEAQSQFERLRAENQRLKGQVEKQDQELAQAQQQAMDLKAECETLKQRVGLAEAEISCSRTNALISLFSEMASERHNRLLRKLLTFDGDANELLHALERYLTDHLKLRLEGEKDAEITLTEENLDGYELEEAIDLPCRAKIIGRGISFEGVPILRVKVEPVEGDNNYGD